MNKDTCYEYCKDCLKVNNGKCDSYGAYDARCDDKGEVISCKKRVLKETSKIDHPSHYNQGGVETIDSIKSVTGDEYNGYLAGNVIKYMGRYKHKGHPIKDLQKALWHLEKLIKEIEEKEIQK